MVINGSRYQNTYVTFFILFLTLSIWKTWAFLPNKQLKDDDKMKGSEDKLIVLILKIIKEEDKR